MNCSGACKERDPILLSKLGLQPDIIVVMDRDDVVAAHKHQSVHCKLQSGSYWSDDGAGAPILKATLSLQLLPQVSL